MIRRHNNRPSSSKAIDKAGVARPRPAPTYSMVAKEIISVGIDPGEHPGYSIFDSGIYYQSGVSPDAHQKEYVVNQALELSRQKKLPLLFISENWPSPFLPYRTRMSHESILGMGMNWGCWLQEIRKLPIPMQNIFRINTLDWRRKYGFEKYPKLQAKDMAIVIASKIIKKTIADHNEAEAILIGNIGCYLELDRKGKK